MNNNNQVIFIGTYGTVLSLDHNSGKELWRTSLPGASYSLVSIYHEDGRVYAGSYGKVFILCAKTGKILAQNELVGQGYGIVSFTTKKSENSSAIPQPQPQIIQQPQLIQQPVPQLIQQPIPQFIQQPLLIQQPPFIQQPPMIQQPPLSVSPQVIEEPELIRHQPLNQFELQQQQNLLNHQFLQQSLLNQQMRNMPQEYVQQMFLLRQQQQMQNQLIQNPQLQFQQLNLQNPQLVPQFPLDNDRLVNEQEQIQKFQQLESDEELARKLDQELNGRNNNNNNNNLQNNNIQIQRNVAQQNNNLVQQPKYISIDDIIFVSLNSYVTALNKYTAQEIWRSQVSSNYGLALSIVFSGDRLLIGAVGNLICLDALNGKELWKNNLPGLRYNNVSVATTTNNGVFRHSNSGSLLHQN